LQRKIRLTGSTRQIGRQGTQKYQLDPAVLAPSITFTPTMSMSLSSKKRQNIRSWNRIALRYILKC